MLEPSSFSTGPTLRLKHQVELARFGERILGAAHWGRAALRSRWSARKRDLATLAIHQRIVEGSNVARRFPDRRMHQNRGVEADHIVALAHDGLCHHASLTLRLSSTPSGP